MKEKKKKTPPAGTDMGKAAVKDKTAIKGIRIKDLNTGMIIITIIVYIMLLMLTVTIDENYTDLEQSTQDYMVCMQMVQQLKDGSDYLTEQVRLYAQTGEITYAQNYFTEANETRSRDLALDGLAQVNKTQELQEEMKEALDCSNLLMETEIYSMRLIAQAYATPLDELPEEVQQCVLSEEDAALDAQSQKEKGRSLVFDDNYTQYKNQIYTHIDNLTSMTLTQAEESMSNASDSLAGSLYKQRVMITVLFLINVLMFCFVTGLVVRPLRIYIKSIQNNTLFDIVGAYEFKYLALTYNNIYEINAENKARLRYSSEHDKLTGLLNRAAYDNVILYLKKAEIPLALVILDIDYFKTVNDTYGHNTGDEILKKTAALLKRSFRSNDEIVRFGGDEFVVLMTDMKPGCAPIVIRKVNEINQLLQHPADGLPPITLSAGASFSEHGFEETMFQRADQALYKAKEQGRCCCKVEDGNAVKNKNQEECGL